MDIQIYYFFISIKYFFEIDRTKKVDNKKLKPLNTLKTYQSQKLSLKILIVSFSPLNINKIIKKITNIESLLYYLKTIFNKHQSLAKNIDVDKNLRIKNLMSGIKLFKLTFRNFKL